MKGPTPVRSGGEQPQGGQGNERLCHHAETRRAWRGWELGCFCPLCDCQCRIPSWEHPDQCVGAPCIEVADVIGDS
jgi:hypothetical protein